MTWKWSPPPVRSSTVDLPSGEGLIEQSEDRVVQPSAMMLTMAGRLAFLLSLPERAVRSVFALVGGGVHETAELVLPRLVRRSRLYEATAKNLLRVSIELVGGVEAPAGVVDEYEPNATKLDGPQDGAGNVVEIGSIAAFGFSPLWLLAAGADVTHGTRVYLDAFVRELKIAGVLAEEAHLAIGRRAPRRARRWHGDGCPSDRHPSARARRAPPLARRPARRRERPSLAGRDGRRSSTVSAPRPCASGARLLEVSTGVGIAFFNSARHVGRQHVLDPYGEDLQPLRDEGFGAYAARVSRPYGSAIARHFDPAKATLTERGVDKLRGGSTS